MIAFVVGTRPELIKTAPVIHELQRRSIPASIIHTGQHYTAELDQRFFEELGLPRPTENLRVGSRPATEQVAAIIEGTGRALSAMPPDFVVVQGDTNSVLGAAIAAHKLRIPIAHLEAGLRSDDWHMPEEGNRVLASRVAAVHFCPTEHQAARLKSEGIHRGVHVVGNTIVDATLRFAQAAQSKATVRDLVGLRPGRFSVVTLHRPSNVDDHDRLRMLLRALRATGEHLGMPVLFPIHPRTRSAIAASGLVGEFAAPIVEMDPLGYLDMLWLLANARIVLTDSGGVQEEACTLRVPCVTLRANTERPETVAVGANRLCFPSEASELRAAVDAALRAPRGWPNPLGDGRAAVRVADILTSPSVRREPSGQPDLHSVPTQLSATA
jgi:UDP-N-acetylglucosamine 2-epimerase (non-hydrolysing)